MRWLILAFVTVVAACASMSGFEQDSADVETDSHPLLRDDLVRYTRHALGTPYAWGGADRSGLDCSGLVFYVYGKVGMRVPRTTEEQLAMSASLDVSQLKAGDLVFFDTGFWQTHVGIYLGNSEFAHAPGSGEDVTISSLNDVYWQEVVISGGSFLHR